MHYGRDKIITDVTEISALIGQLDPFYIFKLLTPLLRCNTEIKPVLMHGTSFIKIGETLFP